MRRLLLALALLGAACGGPAPPATSPQVATTAGEPLALVAGMSSFEVVITSAAGAVVQTLTAPTAAVTCATGTTPPNTAVSFVASDPIKVSWTPEAGSSLVCTWTGPTAGSLGMVAGGSYTGTVLAISDTGVRGGASLPSNPFSLPAIPVVPATPLAVRVGK